MSHSVFIFTVLQGPQNSWSLGTVAPWELGTLPPAVINCDSLSVFKSTLKTHLFNTAYS